ncbi:Signal transduction histidine kinase [Desulfatibacillum alkenivorans DSM 16219]|jgi:signal transduction histidine kinase|uniref:histidine kinase n=1 Tax=Desulfatibacillum alkenivorans DSM 16219 TaxID=1121393 RepID=A0A1M6J3I5_9BACT|nr:HAMP domain-containing sensor histidine kinase [Desulfatibacillum alkenivorans]SHJ41285.1 Signal transduction histidine kinase [Desulfatibacillum alkenivorans DSM 16219]
MKLGRPRLRSILLIVNLVVLLLPLGGIAVFRLYETELVKQTEASLIGQGTLVASMFRVEMARQFDLALDQGEAWDLAYGNPLDPQFTPREKDVYDPIPPSLDIATEPILPQGRDAVPPRHPPDIFAKAAGDAIMPVIISSRKTTLTGTRVLDYQGTVVASSGTEMNESLLVREEVPRALKGEHVSLLRQREQNPSIGRQSRVRVFVAIPVIYGNRVWGAVVLSRTPLDLNKGLYLIRWHLLEAGAILLGVVLLVTTLTTLAISRPMKRLVRQAEQVASGGEGAAPLKRPGTREVAQLSEAISRMATALSQRAEQTRVFANNVSHGFKTPLTSLSASVELLRDPDLDMSDEERARFLEMMESDITRLDRLVKRLMELAKADTTEHKGETVDAILVLESLEEKYLNQGRDISVSHGGNMGKVGMARESLESILVNLLENAWFHGPEDVQVRMEASVDFEEEEERVVIRVSDNGPGISPGNASRIFNPFFTTAAQSGGSGMGLSIVASLVKSHGGAITLDQDAPGACFVISLPRMPA